MGYLCIHLLVGMCTGKRDLLNVELNFFSNNKCVKRKICYHRAPFEIVIE